MLTYGILPESRGGVHLFIFEPPYAIESVPSLWGHAIAYRWRSLPRVRRHKASKPQGSSERVLPWQVTMNQLIYAFSFPHRLLIWSRHVESTGDIGSKPLSDCTFTLTHTVVAMGVHQNDKTFLVSLLRPMGLNVLGCQSHLLQRCHGCLRSRRICPYIPSSHLMTFYRDASSALLQLVN